MWSRGFTLIELLVVLAIVAIVSTLAVPLVFNAMPGVALEGAAREVAAALRAGRGRAIAGNREVAFTLDVDSRRFAVSGPGAMRGTLGKDLDISFTTARSELADETTGVIRFFPDGSSTGGRISLARGEREYHVDVDWLTGRISVRD